MNLQPVFKKAHDAEDFLLKAHDSGKKWAIGGAILGALTRSVKYIFACAAIGYVAGFARGGYLAATEGPADQKPGPG